MNAMKGYEIRIEQAKDLSTRIFVNGVQLKRVIGYSIKQHRALRASAAVWVTQHTDDPSPVERTTLYPIRQLTIITDREPFTPTPEPVTIRLEVDASQVRAVIDDALKELKELLKDD